MEAKEDFQKLFASKIQHGSRWLINQILQAENLKRPSAFSLFRNKAYVK